jgi:Na+-translocating ferredoxin:NAD+ oxidoreductase RnfE subunit
MQHLHTEVYGETSMYAHRASIERNHICSFNKETGCGLVIKFLPSMHEVLGYGPCYIAQAGPEPVVIFVFSLLSAGITVMHQDTQFRIYIFVVVGGGTVL